MISCITFISLFFSFEFIALHITDLLFYSRSSVLYNFSCSFNFIRVLFPLFFFSQSGLSLVVYLLSSIFFLYCIDMILLEDRGQIALRLQLLVLLRGQLWDTSFLLPGDLRALLCSSHSTR
jgi:hypothetical protein